MIYISTIIGGIHVIGVLNITYCAARPPVLVCSTAAYGMLYSWLLLGCCPRCCLYISRVPSLLTASYFGRRRCVLSLVILRGNSQARYPVGLRAIRDGMNITPG